MEINGDFTQSDGATLLIELAGTDIGVNHNQLDVFGTAELAGTLQVTLLDGYEPQRGHHFDLLNSDSLTGTFDSVSLPVLATGLA